MRIMTTKGCIWVEGIHFRMPLGSGRHHLCSIWGGGGYSVEMMEYLALLIHNCHYFSTMVRLIEILRGVREQVNTNTYIKYMYGAGMNYAPKKLHENFNGESKSINLFNKK